MRCRLAARSAAVLGHCFPVWLKFKGGKGVATNAGVSFGLAWPIGLAYALVWLGDAGGDPDHLARRDERGRRGGDRGGGCSATRASCRCWR